MIYIGDPPTDPEREKAIMDRAKMTRISPPEMNQKLKAIFANLGKKKSKPEKAGKKRGNPENTATSDYWRAKLALAEALKKRKN